ncbi:LacI family DNA-binding transcriptional regulator [Cupriavidus respiraculi]|uniref:HTH-type transcriptional regulator GntR n=1 Tax=Cupriavidus respiraculi TaxID=195930 RepID=A0ABN7Y5W1_9BURK|nr:LacI family DNA-binding transcriptional regulator [Cupriavidus respiraculi]CAG9168563.1 HTH-type transcriptional regulator GntR [Cupriavidus respiraculi]
MARTRSVPPPADIQGPHIRVTLKDVAQLAGVSAMTVSRVLNAPENLSAATVAKVRAAIESTGYVPNSAAKALRSSRSRLIAAVLPTLTGPIFLDTIGALTAGLARRGYQLMVGQSGYSSAGEDQLITDIISRRPDGIVLTGVVHTDEGRRRLLASGIPIVETWDLTPEPLDVLVGFSHEAVGREVSRFLVGRGRKKLALIGADDVRSKRRWSSFAKSARALGVGQPVARFVTAPAMLGDGRETLRALLAEHPDTDAIFCSSDALALGVLIEARAQGIDVPGRLAVVGFGDLNFSAQLDPALTTVRVDGPRIGELAAHCIVSRALGQPLETRIFDVGFTIVQRASA